MVNGPTFGPSGISVPFTFDIMKLGLVSHTTIGTSAALINFDAAGLYKINYNIYASGVSSGAQIQVYGRLNADGVKTQGTHIPQSWQEQSASTPKFAGAVPKRTVCNALIQKEFLVSVSANDQLEFFINTRNLNSPVATNTWSGQIWGTGTNLIVQQIA